jgi:hypothetical protein
VSGTTLLCNDDYAEIVGLLVDAISTIADIRPHSSRIPTAIRLLQRLINAGDSVARQVVLGEFEQHNSWNDPRARIWAATLEGTNG